MVMDSDTERVRRVAALLTTNVNDDTCELDLVWFFFGNEGVF